MVDSKLLGRIAILEIKDNNNGTCTIQYEVPDDLKEILKTQFGWKRWSSKKFNDFFLEALTKYAKSMEGESGDTVIGDQHRIDVFDNKSV